MEAAHWITEKAGGRECQELAEFILEAQGKWSKFCEDILRDGW